MDATTLSWLIAIGVAALILKAYFPSYLQEKGKNLATKEDIGAITEKVEEVKDLYNRQLKDIEHQNALLLEQLRSQQQLRMAAADKRLAAHQEAFTLWRSLVRTAHDDEVAPVVLQCQDWWEKNCLYLSPKAREAFNNAYFSASGHRVLVRSRADFTLVQQSWASVMQAGNALVAGVELPSLGEREGMLMDAKNAA